MLTSDTTPAHDAQNLKESDIFWIQKQAALDPYDLFEIHSLYSSTNKIFIGFKASHLVNGKKSATTIAHISKFSH